MTPKKRTPKESPSIYRVLTFISVLGIAILIILGATSHSRENKPLRIQHTFVVLCRCFALFATLDALKINRINGRFWTTSRQEKPIAFWTAIVPGFLVSAALFLGALLL
jgi:hypothetical protein